MIGVVLAGGASRRFGEDKLAVRLDDGSMLIDRPIGALRSGLGARVGIVGACAEEVARRADFVIDDPYPGVGPIGGVIAALESVDEEVFVLAGDLISISDVEVRLIARESGAPGDEVAVLANAGGVQPCIGVYRREALAVLRDALEAGEHSLHRALEEGRTRLVSIPISAVKNVNRPSDLV